jgi:mannose-6-phosphate isomerase-like protein (cupin superfamily)
MRVIAGAGQYTRPDARQGTHWAEHLRVPDLSVGTYSIPAGGFDNQEPHGEDEIYVVMAGRGRFESGGEGVDVAPGTVLYVPAGEEHRFMQVSEDLAVLVLFAPAEGDRCTKDDHEDNAARST